MTPRGIFDPASCSESDFSQLKLLHTEQVALGTTKSYSAIDVYVDARNAGPIAGSIVRVYAITNGSRVLVLERTFGNFSSGRIARVRGMATKYEVSVICGGQPNASRTISLSYVAWGHEPSYDIGQDVDAMPATPPTMFRESEAGVWPQLVRKGPVYLRQAFGSLTSLGGDAQAWVQFWDGDVDDVAPATLMTQVRVATIGQVFDFDFRDPHRLSLNNDGMYAVNGLWVACSTDPFVINASNATISLGYELRYLTS